MVYTQLTSVPFYPQAPIKCIWLNAQPRLMEKALYHAGELLLDVPQTPASAVVTSDPEPWEVLGPLGDFEQLLTAVQLHLESRCFHALFLFGDGVTWGKSAQLQSVESGWPVTWSDTRPSAWIRNRYILLHVQRRKEEERCRLFHCVLRAFAESWNASHSHLADDREDTLPFKSFCRRICISLECNPALGHAANKTAQLNSGAGSGHHVFNVPWTLVPLVEHHVHLLTHPSQQAYIYPPFTEEDTKA